MSLNEFIFSEKSIHRYTRHIVFWVAWWLYFFGSQYFLPQPFRSWETGYLKWGMPEFVRSLLMLSIHILSCYVIIYFLLPRYLLKAKYFRFLIGLLLLGFAMVQASFFIASSITPILENKFPKSPGPVLYAIKSYATISMGVLNAIKIIIVAVAIKLAKHWWFKQKEKERLEQGKIDAELQLLKAQIHPSFLFNTLNNIYSFTLLASPKAPEMLLKLSDILSYMLYECNDREVPLEKEIKMLKDYMVLEKTRYGDKLEMNILVKGKVTEDNIAPLLLLRFIENSFKQCASNLTEQPWINLEIQIENHVLEMKLMNGKPLETITPGDGEDDLEQVRRRLQLLYPGRHILTIAEEPEIMMVNLQLTLQVLPVNNETLSIKRPALREQKYSVLN